MAKGLEKHREREAALSALGKSLARRAGSRCELCAASGVPLRIFEVPPAPSEPDLDQSVLVCETCRDQLESPRSMLPEHWRCAAEAVWSEVPAAQVLAARVLDRLGKTEMWAREALELVDFEESLEEWIGKQPL